MDESSEKSWHKSDWLRSVQLWNQSPDPPPKSEELSGEGLVAKKAKRSDNGEETKSVEEIHGQTNGSSTSETKEPQKSGGSKKEDREGSLSRRKQRRSWSQDLHRRFLHSLQQLGGADVATPKQIRELMKVDGLTNDEVKSHLQKYRLHTRRPAPPPSQASGSEAQAPQFVVVGGVWAPPSDYTTMALPVPANSEGDRASGAPRSGMYTPMAAPPLALPHHQCQQFEFNQKPQVKSKNSESRGDGLARCISLSMSSATRSGPSPVY
uniref:HTH myb-type domain-containing protein n=1 Tax=Kalanchoe fedtschenkoi TaxID=63787 RepID=A0A7N0UDH1_KALFE